MNKETFTKLVDRGKIQLRWTSTHEKVNVPYFIPKKPLKLFIVIGIKLGIVEFVHIS